MLTARSGDLKTRIMKQNFRIPVLVFTIIILKVSAILAIEDHGTTIKRNADGCTVDIILQIAVTGTEEQRQALENVLVAGLGSLDCVIPCLPPKLQCCQVEFTFVVVLASSVPPGDLDKYHQITIQNLDNVTQASSVSEVGGQGTSRTGTWDSDNPDRDKIYVHETLHLLGADDQYCSRKRLIRFVSWVPIPYSYVELDCTPPPPPQPPDCCVPPMVLGARCGVPCTGWAGNIMASIGATATIDCQRNIIDNLPAGLNDCPDPPCCPEPVPIDINIPTGGGSPVITPDPATVPNYATVTWMFKAPYGQQYPNICKILLPPNSPVTFGNDTTGAPILSYAIPAFQQVTTTPANWAPGVDSVKYTLEFYQNAALMFTVDPYLRNSPQGIESFGNADPGLMSLHPNPARNEVTVRFSRPFTRDRMKVFSESGSCVAIVSLNNYTETLVWKIPDLPEGMYFVTVENQNRVITWGKLVIKR